MIMDEVQGKQPGQEFSEVRRKFDEIISELPAYGSSLAKIKATYDGVITKIETHHRVRSIVELQETQLRLQESTKKNYLNYQHQLETKLNELKEENKKFKESISNNKEQTNLKMKEKLREIEIERGKKRIDSTRRRRLRLNVEQATDIGHLDQELERVDKELQEIKIATEKRHVPVSRKTALQAQLQDKEKEKVKLERENNYLCCLFIQLSAALKSATSVYSSLQSGETPFTSTVIIDAITDTIKGIDNDNVQRVIDQINEEDRDEEKEAEFMLYCTEKFHELFDNELYEEAALLVATSPMGFLRNMKTLEKFKSVSPATIPCPEITPLLHYCTTLMHSASLFKPLSSKEAMEFVLCALDCRQYVLLMKWIASGNLPITKEIAMETYQRCSCSNGTRCVCHCCEIALTMFETLGYHSEAASCLTKLGMYSKLKNFIEEKRFQRNDILSLLYSNPVKEFALSLVTSSSPSSDPPLCDIIEVFYILCQSKQYDVCEEVLKEYTEQYSTSITEIFARANSNPAYSETVRNLITSLEGTPLQWMVSEIIAGQAVTSALDTVLDDMKHNDHVKQFTDCEDSKSSRTSITYTESSAGTSGRDSHTPIRSRPSLAKSSCFDLGDGDDMQPGSASTYSYDESDESSSGDNNTL